MYEFIFGFSILFQQLLYYFIQVCILSQEAGNTQVLHVFSFCFLKKILVILGAPFYFHMSFRITPHILDLSGKLEPCYKDCLGSDVLRTGADSKAG